MKKKLLNVIKEMVFLTLEGESFMYEAPKEFSRTFDYMRNSDLDWEELEKFGKKIRKELKKTEKFTVRKHSVSDHGDVVLDMVPLPLSNIFVDCGNILLRYSATLFLYEEGAVMSLRRVQYATDSKEFTGVDLSKEEGKLVKQIKGICGGKALTHPMVLDMVFGGKDNIARHTHDIRRPSEERLADAVRNLPAPIVWAAIHALIATLMPWLTEVARPFYFPAIRLSDNKEVAAMQIDILKNVLAGFSYGRATGQNLLRLPELELQDQDSIDTLHCIEGLPVLVRVDRDAVQKDITEEMQRSHCSLIATGIAKHPLKTVPIMVGKALPAGNVILALDWMEAECVDTELVAALQAGFGYIAYKTDELVDMINLSFDRLSIVGRKYAEAYFGEMTRILDEVLFSSCEYRGALVEFAAQTIDVIHEQQEEQQERFDRAFAILEDGKQYQSGVAPSAKEMRPHHFGFTYKTKAGETGLAIELKEDFPRFIKEYLGLLESDSLEFRIRLRECRRVKEVQRNIRGRTGESCAHVFIQRSCEG